MHRRFASASSRASVVVAESSSAAMCAQRRRLSYKPRTRDLTFAFTNVLNMYDHYHAIGATDASDRETVESLFEECGKLCAQQLFPLYQSGDAEGCQRSQDNGGSVKTPKGFPEAYRSVVEGGWAGICGPKEFGGLEMPQSIGVVTKEMMGTANWAFLGYPGLTAGAVSTIDAWGSDELKKLYFPKLTTGEWTGTMCMTEPHCGTDLGQCRTSAVSGPEESDPNATHHHPQQHYLVTGTKIFITGGDHDLAENIVHVVLAKMRGAPSGTKGLSLFLVPKYVPRADGTIDPAGKLNVTCARVESKMGMAASATCQLEFQDSVAYLLGEPETGMKAMFTFMNEARIGAAIQGVCHAELAFQNALAYARDRKSLRGLSETKEPEAVADAIIHHPNVRHNILFCKAVAEGGRLMCIDLARMVDLINTAKSPKDQHMYTEEAGFYTPIAKALLTELGLEAASCGVQVFGGHGYIKGNGMEQILRDARIGTLYEGTTGVQALDFVGRKVLKSKTREPARFAARLVKVAKPHVMKKGDIGKCARQLLRLSLQWRFGVGALFLNASKDLENVGAASQDALMFAGYTTLGYYWLRMAVAAQKEIDAGKDTDGFYAAKVATCKFYFDRVLPRASAHYDMMMQPAGRLMKSDQSKWDM